jgi:NADH-quinone oxidoreductase subunit C
MAPSKAAMNLNLETLANQLSEALTKDPLAAGANVMAGSRGEGGSICRSPSPTRFQTVDPPTQSSIPDGTVTSDQAGPAAALFDGNGFAARMSSGVVQLVDYAHKGYHLEATVSPCDVVRAAWILDQEGFALDTITGVDWITNGEMEIVYDYFHLTAAFRVVIRSRVPRTHPEIPTISGVFPGANWHERETHDFFGIRFLGHPDLTPFLLPEDADYHPLRKDFTL